GSRLELGDLEHLDRDARALRDSSGQLERLLATRTVDEVEAADRLLRLGERTVGDEGIRPGTHDGRRVAGLERLARDMCASLAQHVGEGKVLFDDRAAVATLSAASPSVSPWIRNR